MHPARTRRHLRRGGALLSVLVLALGACDDGDDNPEAVDPTMSSTSTIPSGSSSPSVGPATDAPTPASTVAAGPTGPGCGALPIDEAAGRSLGDLIASTPELGRFTEAWQRAGLADRLLDQGPVTLIAPTDAAFEALDPQTGDSLAADPAGALARVLELHLVNGDHPLADLLAARTLGTPAGNLTATDADGDVLLDTGGGPATVTCRDVVAANGRLHLVDGVLLPPPADTEAVGGSRLFRVDPATGAATSVGAFGEELGVLDVVAVDDTTLLGLTDSAELITFRPDAPDAPTARVPIAGVEGATLLALDQTADGALLAVTDLSRLYRVDPTSGAATPLGAVVEPGIDDLGVAIDVHPDGTVRLLVATGTDLTIDPDSGAVLATGEMPAFAEGDPNSGVPARIVAAATTGDELLAVDATTGALARLDEDGILTTIGSLGVVLTDGAGLDATPNGELYLTVPG